MKTTALFLTLLLPVLGLAAEPRDAAVTDPAPDAAHPTRNQQVLVPSHGVGMNGLFLLASGDGPKPTVVLLHGLPGNERNLDLAQAMRRAGWNVLTFTYRGAWGSPGQFSIAHAVEDADAALDFVRTPEVATKYGIDRNAVVIAGHSMGGFAAARAAAHRLRQVQIALVAGQAVQQQHGRMRPRAGGEEEERVHLRTMAVDQQLLVARRMRRIARRIDDCGAPRIGRHRAGGWSEGEQ